MSNLPSWNGASVVYARAAKIAEHLNKQSYNVQRKAWKRKTGFKFVPNDEAERIIRAMDAGDEELLKGLVLGHLKIVFGTEP